ncbi:hypothetical protein [Cupriavidus necator]|uniref:hypothetical protein n=1 Tax=Cupriavidus necator TaxID=106590 RepID=UPI00129ECA40|nr:hypothetical protein [Cupriavidus necator]
MKSHYTRAVLRVLQDWKAREVKKPRGMLPASETSSTLRYIRKMACRQAGTLDCASWSNGELAAPSRDYPCDRCSAPGVPIGDFLFAVFGTSEVDEPLKGERALRKWMNSEAPMHADDFRRVLAHAFVHGWLNQWQVCTLWESVLELEASSSALRWLRKKVRDAHRVRPIEDPARTLTLQIEKEIALNRDRIRERAKANITRLTVLDDTEKEILLREAYRGG